MKTIEENALHLAALSFARAQFHPLEVRLRVDRAQQVLYLLREENPATDREFFQRDELEVAEELATYTLLHAGEIDTSPPTSKPQHTESLLLRARLCVRSAQNQFTDPDRTLRAVVEAFNDLVGLLSTCARLPGSPPCSRDGQCPEHGKNRPGQCVPESGTEDRGPGTGVGNSP